MNPALPKRLASYVHETGVRALDHLADTLATPEEGAQANALQTLVGNWRSMTDEQKEDFVGTIAAAVGEVIAASALLPVGIKAGKKAIKSARKVLKRSAKSIRKSMKKTASAVAVGKRKRKKKQKK